MSVERGLKKCGAVCVTKKERLVVTRIGEKMKHTQCRFLLNPGGINKYGAVCVV